MKSNLLYPPIFNRFATRRAKIDLIARFYGKRVSWNIRNILSRWLVDGIAAAVVHHRHSLAYTYAHNTSAPLLAYNLNCVASISYLSILFFSLQMTSSKFVKLFRARRSGLLVRQFYGHFNISLSKRRRKLKKMTKNRWRLVSFFVESLLLYHSQSVSRKTLTKCGDVKRFASATICSPINVKIDMCVRARARIVNILSRWKLNKSPVSWAGCLCAIAQTSVSWNTPHRPCSTGSRRDKREKNVFWYKLRITSFAGGDPNKGREKTLQQSIISWFSGFDAAAIRRIQNDKTNNNDIILKWNVMQVVAQCVRSSFEILRSIKWRHSCVSVSIAVSL